MAYTNIIPVMTSNTAPSGVASASNIYSSGFEAYRSMDKVQGLYWFPGVGLYDEWVQYQSISAETCTAYSIKVGQDSANWTPSAWSLEASNTGAFSGEEVTLDSQSGFTSGTWTTGETKQFVFANTTGYLYHRIHVTAVNSTEWYIDEVEFLVPLPVPSGTSTLELTTTGEVIPIATPAVGDTTVSLTVTGIAYPINAETLMFTFIQRIQTASTGSTFKFIQRIEQAEQSTIIGRVNT